MVIFIHERIHELLHSITGNAYFGDYGGPCQRAKRVRRLLAGALHVAVCIKQYCRRRLDKVWLVRAERRCLAQHREATRTGDLSAILTFSTNTGVSR